MSRKKINISELNLKKIGGRFAYIRLYKGLNQEEFADILGISKGNISAIENHKYDPSFQPISQIIKKFDDVNPEWLLSGEGKTFRQTPDDTYIYKEGDDPELVDLLKMTREVLKSETDYAAGLAANIRSFHKSVLMERQIRNHEERLRRIEAGKPAGADMVRKEDPPEQKEEIIKRRAM